MYLSRLILNPSSWEVRRDLNRPYELHRTISHAFPHDPPHSDDRVLFRLEYQPNKREWWTLVQSRYLPDWAFFDLEEWNGYLLKPAEVKSFEPLFTAGAGYRFRLLANPTFKTTDEETQKRIRLSLLDAEEQAEWLQRKLTAAGAKSLDFSAVQQGMRRSQKKNPDDQTHTQTHFAVLFEGVLRVTDPAALRAAVESGIGSAKGYGFGLLSLAPT